MLRRTMLKSLVALPLLVPDRALGLATRRDRDTRISTLELFRLKVNRRGNWLVVRLGTENGLTGLGDSSHGSHDEETIAWLRRFMDLLRGRSIFEVEWFRAASARLLGSNAPSSACVAASALEHCLWDLAGKALGVSVYDLFGGKLRDAVRLYANINRSTDPRTPQGFAAMAERAVRAGFQAVKLAPFDAIPIGATDARQRAQLTDEGVACGRAVREAIGPGRALLIDAHSRFGLEDGAVLATRLEPLDLFWLEEVAPADPLDALAAINRAAKMPTAGGEAIRGVAGFYPYVKAGAVDIVMPDIKICGGLLELKKIAGLAEGAGMPVSPHGPASPVGNIAAAHVCATLPNFLILEHAYGEVPWRAELLEPAEEIVAGMLPLSDRPGFGVSLNEKVAARFAL